MIRKEYDSNSLNTISRGSMTNSLFPNKLNHDLNSRFLALPFLSVDVSINATSAQSYLSKNFLIISMIVSRVAEP